MKRKNHKVVALVAQRSIVSFLLLSVGLVAPIPARSAESPTTEASEEASELILAQRLTAEEREELERLRDAQQTQEQVQAEANRVFSRTTTLFNVLLAVLALLLVAAIAALWLLRRAVIREVTAIAKNHVKELGDLEGEIVKTKSEVESILQEAEDIADELSQYADEFQAEVGTKRDVLSKLVAEIGQLRDKTAAEFETHLKAIQQN
ncbi:MAG: hypothetical protein HC879_18750 [Leptolyngbyaceae cyanobacterium SL_5_9]|nr:hypothetical protein [Leptolyngbyaceae cyanobacterium SL_5_9]